MAIFRYLFKRYFLILEDQKDHIQLKLRYSLRYGRESNSGSGFLCGHSSGHSPFMTMMWESWLTRDHSWPDFSGLGTYSKYVKNLRESLKYHELAITANRSRNAQFWRKQKSKTCSMHQGTINCMHRIPRRTYMGSTIANFGY